jgi:hypothetical protein
MISGKFVKLHFVLSAIILFALLLAPFDGHAGNPCEIVMPKNVVPRSVETKVQRLSAYLTSQGYEVMRGFFVLVGPEQCQCAIETWGNCYGNNPVAPYIFPVMPAWPEEFVDRALLNLFGAMPEGFTAVYRLDPREAVIVLGHLPPPGKYFGIQSYLVTREGTINTKDPIYKILSTLNDPALLKQFFDYSPNPRRIRLFASIGNSTNNVIIQRKSGGSFNRERFFVSTPDRFMEKTLREAIIAANAGQTKDVFVEPISSSYSIGLDERADDFLTMIRYALPYNPEAGESWRERLPLVVLRVRDRKTTRTVQPYPPVTIEKRTAFPERWLDGDLSRLVTLVKQEWGQPEANVQPMNDIQTMLDLVGPHCAARGMNCLGDTQDTSYQSTFNLFLDAGQIYAVIGTLDTTILNSTYTNLAVYRSSTLSASISISDKDLQGTAAGYSDTVDNADKFYIQYFARNCSEYAHSLPACRSISEDMVPRGEAIKIMQRNYIRPGAVRGPDSAKTLSPRIVILDGR